MSHPFCPLSEWKLRALIFVAVLAALLGSLAIVGQIPRGDGAGWDGYSYRRIVDTLANGGSVTGDPYRLIRVSGFIPLLAAAWLGVPRDSLVFVQTVLNLCMLPAAAVFFHASLRGLNVGQRTALYSTAALVGSWSFLIMPVYYPILSDHAALTFVCVCLWCWTRGNRWTLFFFCAYLLWVLPGLFLLPLVLAAMPLRRDRREAGAASGRVLDAVWVSLVVLSLLMLAILMHRRGIGVDRLIERLVHPDYPYIPELVFLAAALSAVCVLAMLRLGARLLVDRTTWRSISPADTTLALLCLGASALAMFRFIDWSRGFTGPPFLSLLASQSLAAPLKPLVAHFLTYGPAMILGIYSCLRWGFSGSLRSPRALLVVMACFMPFLLLGSESRQWIGVFPVAVAVFAIEDYSSQQRIGCLIVSAALLLPCLWLRTATETAFRLDLDFDNPLWQVYFSRQGPWMSSDAYGLGLLGLSLSALLLFLLRPRPAPEAHAGAMG